MGLAGSSRISARGLMLAPLLFFTEIPEARASCWIGGDAEVRRMQALVDSDPRTALPQIETMIESARRRGDPDKLGWLLSVQAAAYTNLEHDEEVVRLTENLLGMEITTPLLRAQVLINTLTLLSDEQSPKIVQTISELESFQARFPKGTASHVCTTNAIALLYRLMGNEDKAIRLGGNAYREAKRAGLEDAAGIIAWDLSTTFLRAGDAVEADSLARQAELWAAKKGYTVYLLLATWQRTQIYDDVEPDRAAPKYIELARRAREVGLNPTAYETSACRSLVKSRQFKLALRYCSIARKSNNSDSIVTDFIIDLYLGEAELALGRPGQALTIFDALMAQPPTPITEPGRPKLLTLRAQANAELGNFAEAYKDTVSAMEITAQTNAVAQAQEVSQLRARFGTDRQRIANAELERDLARAEVRDQQRNTWLIAGGGWLALLAAMLVWVIYSGRRHRRKLEKLAAEARELARTKAGLLATMSHEIRAPLGSLVLASSRLAQSAGIPDDSRLKADRLGQAADSLLNQLDDLLLFSRIDAKQLPVFPDWFAPEKLVNEAAGLLDAKAQDAGVEIVVTIGDDMFDQIHCDGKRITQVLTNLIDNAIKHSGGKRIDVTLAALANDQFEIVVSDDGAGIPEDQLPLIMRSFAQVDGATSSETGFGLGLAICKGLVELMGGYLVLESPQGSGLHVKICMPQAEGLSIAA